MRFQPVRQLNQFAHRGKPGLELINLPFSPLLLEDAFDQSPRRDRWEMFSWLFLRQDREGLLQSVVLRISQYNRHGQNESPEPGVRSARCKKVSDIFLDWLPDARAFF